MIEHATAAVPAPASITSPALLQHHTPDHFMKPEIAIVLPAYNEEEDLPILLENIRTKLAATDLNWKVIIVDDGLKDRTAAIAEDASLIMPLTLIRDESQPRPWRSH